MQVLFARPAVVVGYPARQRRCGTRTAAAHSRCPGRRAPGARPLNIQRPADPLRTRGVVLHPSTAPEYCTRVLRPSTAPEYSTTPWYYTLASTPLSSPSRQTLFVLRGTQQCINHITASGECHLHA